MSDPVGFGPLLTHPEFIRFTNLDDILFGDANEKMPVVSFITFLETVV